VEVPCGTGETATNYGDTNYGDTNCKDYDGEKIVAVSMTVQNFSNQYRQFLNKNYWICSKVTRNFEMN
jgi:hypothetical protein